MGKNSSGHVNESNNSSGKLLKLGSTNKEDFEDRILKAREIFKIQRAINLQNLRQESH